MRESIKKQLSELIEGLEETTGVSSQLLDTLDLAKQITEKDDMSDTSLVIAISIIEEMIIHKLELDKSKVHVSYAPLHAILARYGIDLTHACKAAGIPLNVRTKINKNQSVQINVLNRLAVLFGCDVDELIEFVSEHELIERRLIGMRIKNAPNITAYAINAQYSESYKSATDEDDDSPVTRNHFFTIDSYEDGVNELVRIFEVKDNRYKPEDYDDFLE